MVESQPSKLLVASSILVSRSNLFNNIEDPAVHAFTPFTPFSFPSLLRDYLVRKPRIGSHLHRMRR